jgi:Ca2+-binding EF-hand superfamily protein
MKSNLGKWLAGAVGLIVLVALASVARAQDPNEFLRRVDANGNGMIDPEEMEGRFGFFVKRMAENNPRLDTSKPIPISKMTEEFNRMREERMRSGGGGPPFGGGGPPPGGGGPPFGGGGPPFGGGGPPFGGGDGGGRGDRSNRGDRRDGGPPPSDDQSNPYRPRTTSVKPLVPGFGVEEELMLPSGFGSEAELFTVEITEADRQEAARAFGYYDQDKNGKIDPQEMKNSRFGSDLPLYDRNRDGVLTMNEMEYRYARRRVENAQGGKAGDSPGSGRSSSGSKDRDKSKDEEKSRFADRKSYRVQPPVGRLPKGLPDWFMRNDADGDGQVSMPEFSVSWSEAVLADFGKFDLNEDGLIEPQECLKAQAEGASRGTESVASATPPSNAGTAPAPASVTAPASGSTSPPSAAPSASSSETPSAPAAASPPAAAAASPTAAVKIDARYLDYYRKLIGKYDKNGDGQLGPDEWGTMSRNPQEADADGNQRISVEEYARWSMQK